MKGRTQAGEKRKGRGEGEKSRKERCEMEEDRKKERTAPTLAFSDVFIQGRPYPH